MKFLSDSSVVFFKSPCVMIAPLVYFCPRTIARPFYKKSVRIFTKSSQTDANSAFYGRFQPFSVGLGNIYAFKNARVFSKSDFEVEKILSSFFRKPSGKPVWIMPSFRDFRASEKNLGSPLLGLVFLARSRQNGLKSTFNNGGHYNGKDNQGSSVRNADDWREE